MFLARLGPLLHSANLLLLDASGHDRIRLLVADDGTPRIEAINAAGELVWSAPSERVGRRAGRSLADHRVETVAVGGEAPIR